MRVRQPETINHLKSNTKHEAEGDPYPTGAGDGRTRLLGPPISRGVGLDGVLLRLVHLPPTEGRPFVMKMSTSGSRRPPSGLHNPSIINSDSALVNDETVYEIWPRT